MFKLCLKLWSINENYIEEAAKLYKQGLYQYIELYVVPDSLNMLEKWKTLEIPFIIHSTHFAHGFNLAKIEKESRNLEIYKEVKTFADELNAKYIIFHGGIGGNINETARQLKSFNEPRALIENKPRVVYPKLENGEYCKGYNIDEIKHVMNITGCGFCLDFGHALCSANSQKKEVYSYIEEFLKLKPNMFHLSDIKDTTSEYDSHSHLGKGEFNIKRISEMLFVDDMITVETIKESKTNLDDFVEDIKFINKVREERNE